jgi:hypothetical protein
MADSGLVFRDATPRPQARQRRRTCEKVSSDDAVQHVGYLAAPDIRPFDRFIANQRNSCAMVRLGKQKTEMS